MSMTMKLLTEGAKTTHKCAQLYNVLLSRKRGSPVVVAQGACLDAMIDALNMYCSWQRLMHVCGVATNGYQPAVDAAPATDQHA